MERWAAVIADTDVSSVASIKEWLSPRRYDVTTLTDPDEIVKTASSHPRAIVLASLSLPGLEASRLCRELGDKEGFTYVLLMLDRYDPDLITEAFEACADDVMAKPLISAELRMRLQHAARVLALEEIRSQLEGEGALLAEISARAQFHSRRYLEVQLDGEIARAHRFTRSLAVALAEIRSDIDQERVMRSIGKFLSEHFRSKVDWVARYDDHKFAFVLPETSLAGAVAAMRRLDADLSDSTLLTSTGLPKELSVNFGVSALDTARLARKEPPSTRAVLEAAEAYLRDAARERRQHIAAGPFPHP